MTTSYPGGDGREVLSQGETAPRSGSARVWGPAAVCLALGVLVGAQLDDVLDERRATQQLEAAHPALSAGVIQEAPDAAGDLRFAVPLYNGGSGEVTVNSVTAVGWVVRDSRAHGVTIPPDSWAMLPLLVQIDCDAIGGAAPERLTVRVATAHESFEQWLSMPAPSPALTREAARLCLRPQGSVPTRQDLQGSWRVEEAGRYRGTVVRLRADGTFAIDPDLLRFGPELDAVGTYARSGGTLRLAAEGGSDCRRGDRTTWAVTLLEDGRLHIRHRPGRGPWCGVERGEVWVARAIPGRPGAGNGR